MSKNQLITGAIIILFVGAFIAINRMEPSRVSEEQLAEAEEVGELIEAAEIAEAEAAAETEAVSDHAEGESAEEEVAQDVDTPDSYQVEFVCSNGTFVVEVYPEWAPIGAARFREAVEAGVFDEARFFRVIPGFVAQFGIPADPQAAAEWSEKTIPAEPVKASNVRGTITYAMLSGRPDSRTTQVFINFGDNTNLDGMGFAPFGKVVSGMDVVDSIESKYGQDPDQMQIKTRGVAYLKENYPDLDYIEEARIVETDDSGEDAESEA